MKCRKQSLKKFYKKSFDLKVFQGLEDRTYERIKFINKYSKEIDSLSETIITKDDERYIYKQVFTYKKDFHKFQKNVIKKHLEKLAKDLDKLSQLGFIHGDLNKKNILFDGIKFMVIDLEPCLEQVINGKKKLMFTIPYWSLNDMRNNKITTETDKIGFYSFCKWAFERTFEITNTLEKFKIRQSSDYELFFDDETIIVNSSFSDIVSLIEKSNGA